MTSEEFLTKASEMTGKEFAEWIKPYLIDRHGNPWQYKEPIYRAFIEIDGRIVPLFSTHPVPPLPYD